jgi:hypothetical protein
MTDTRTTTERDRREAETANDQLSESAGTEPAATEPEPRRGTAAIAEADSTPDNERPEAAHDDDSTHLFDNDATNRLRTRWSDVQSAFVDDPRKAVKTADELVADVMKQLADGFAKERRSLEEQWSRGDDVSTEDLRIALQRYRSFFDRLLEA